MKNHDMQDNPDKEKPFVAELTDKSIHGRYVGFDPANLMKRLPFEKCLTGFSIDESGFKVDSSIEHENELTQFTIIFPASWVFHLENWGVDHCLAIRQHAESDLAQLIFDFNKIESEYGMIDVTMWLGEGVPAILGVFFREDRIDAEKTLLKQIYEHCQIEMAFQDTEEIKEIDDQSNRSYIIPLDLMEAETIMSGNDTAAMIDVLEKAGHNLWTGNEQEIADRLKIVKLGISHHKPLVQVKAFSTFVLGGRVVGGVKIITDFIDEQLQLAENNQAVLQCRPNVFAEAVSGAICMLSEAAHLNRKKTKIYEQFETLDLEEVKNKSNGQVTPEIYETLERISHTRPCMNFSIDDYNQLRQSLNQVIIVLSEKRELEKVVNDCKKALTDYSI